MINTYSTSGRINTKSSTTSPRLLQSVPGYRRASASITMYRFIGVHVYQNNDATTNTTATARNYLLVEHVPTASSNYLRKHGPADNQEDGPRGQ